MVPPPKVDNGKNPVFIHSSNQNKYQPTLGQGDTLKQTGPRKPFIQNEKTQKVKSKSAPQENVKFAPVKIQEKQTGKVASPGSRDPETSSLISKGSLDEFDKPFESRPVRQSVKEYHDKQTEKLEGKMNQAPAQQPPNLVAAFDSRPQAGVHLKVQPVHEAQHQPNLSLASDQRVEYPRFFPLTMTVLESHADSWAGIPVGLLTLHQLPTGFEHQFPVYIIHQRLGLMSTSEELLTFGLLPTNPVYASIWDTVGGQWPALVQLRLSLFTADLLTAEEVQRMPFPVTTPATEASTNPLPPNHFYEEEIEVFGFFD